MTNALPGTIDQSDRQRVPGRSRYAINGRTSAATPYPKATSGVRFESRSAARPDTTFSKLPTASATPRRYRERPLLRPSVGNEDGEQGKIMSEPMSVKKLVTPRSSTVRGSRWRRFDEPSCSRGRYWTVFQEASLECCRPEFGVALARTRGDESRTILRAMSLDCRGDVHTGLPA